MSLHEYYDNPLIGRYASRRMARLWSPQAKFSTWRRLWVALAEAQCALGLKISEEQIAALRAQVDLIDFDAANAYESRFRHDVMAHIHALGDVAPVARPIIHLGATSCFVTDNADLILMCAALELVRDKTVAAIDALASFAETLEGFAVFGLYPFSARATGDGRQACVALVL